MESLRSKKGFICDMDGVIYHGDRLLPDVKEFVEWLYKETSRSCSLRIRANARRVSFSRSLREWDFMLTRVIFIPVPLQRQNLSAVRSPAARRMLSAPPDSSTRSTIRASQ